MAKQAKSKKAKRELCPVTKRDCCALSRPKGAELTCRGHIEIDRIISGEIECQWLVDEANVKAREAGLA